MGEVKIMLLCVNSSVRKEGSRSRALVDIFAGIWRENYPSEEILWRDVGENTPSHPSAEYTVANYTPPEQRTKEMVAALQESDQLIDEISAAEHLVFGVPMYNFCVPSTLKAYIDNLVRVGRTFGVTPDGGFEGLLVGKKMLVVSTKGAVYEKGTPMESFDHVEPYMRTVFGFMGITNMQFVAADGMDFADEAYREASLTKARDEIKRIAQEWQLER